MVGKTGSGGVGAKVCKGGSGTMEVFSDRGGMSNSPSKLRMKDSIESDTKVFLERREELLFLEEFPSRGGSEWCEPSWWEDLECLEDLDL